MGLIDPWDPTTTCTFDNCGPAIHRAKSWNEFADGYSAKPHAFTNETGIKDANVHMTKQTILLVGPFVFDKGCFLCFISPLRVICLSVARKWSMYMANFEELASSPCATLTLKKF